MLRRFVSPMAIHCGRLDNQGTMPPQKRFDVVLDVEKFGVKFTKKMPEEVEKSGNKKKGLWQKLL